MGALNELIAALAICKSVFFVVFVGMAWVLIPRLIRSLTVRCCQRGYPHVFATREYSDLQELGAWQCGSESIAQISNLQGDDDTLDDRKSVLERFDFASTPLKKLQRATKEEVATRKLA